MDAPKGRYSIVEKGGRLIVIDNATGGPASPVSRPIEPEAVRPRTTTAPATSSASTPTQPRQDAATAPSARRRDPPFAGPGVLPGTFARLLVRLVTSGRDAQGRALIRWKWETNGNPGAGMPRLIATRSGGWRARSSRSHPESASSCSWSSGSARFRDGCSSPYGSDLPLTGCTASPGCRATPAESRRPSTRARGVRSKSAPVLR